MTMRPRPRPREHQILFAGSLAAALALGCSDNRIAILSGTTYAPDGHLVVFGWPIRVYDSALRETSPAIPSPADRSEVAAAALSPDGMLALVAHGQFSPSLTPSSATLFRVPDGEIVGRISFAGFAPAGGSNVGGFALSPQGDRAFLASEVHRTSDGALLWTAPSRLSSPLFSADGSILVAIGLGLPPDQQAPHESILMAFDAGTGVPIYANALGGGSELGEMSLFGDGSRLAGVLTTCQSRGCWQYLVTFSIAEGRLLSKVAVPVGVTVAGYVSCARTQGLCASSYRDDTSVATALWQADGAFLGTLAKVPASSSISTEPPPRPRLSPDGSTLALVGDTAVSVYRVSDGHLTGEILARNSP